MSTIPSTLVGAYQLVEEPKARELDRDRAIVLTHEAAQTFVSNANSVLEGSAARTFLGDKMQAFANIITETSGFPFRSCVEDGSLVLVPAFDKDVHAPVLKDVSDGVTDICKRFVRECGITECGKFELGMLFQLAIHRTYIASGMSEGSHTKYFYRGC